MRVFGAILIASLMTPVFSYAQDGQTLADIRQELEYLYGDIVSLKRDLSTAGTASQQNSKAPALQRIDALEAEVRRLTGAIEEKQFWVEGIVKDGTNRIGDLEFRLCELEDGCDVTTLDRTAPLGGKIPARLAAPTTVQTESNTPDVSGATTSERSTFERAMAALEAKDFAKAASQFDALIANFPGGPLTGEAHYWKGTALAGSEEWGGAARSFLESFSGSPQGTKAPDALFRLGLSLKELGQMSEACLMLAEVPIRYPSAAVLPQARAEHAALGCQ